MIWNNKQRFSIQRKREEMERKRFAKRQIQILNMYVEMNNAQMEDMRMRQEQRMASIN